LRIPKGNAPLRDEGEFCGKSFELLNRFPQAVSRLCLRLT
jgi:hypothetical protein